MSALLWRIIIAAICVVLIILIIPPFLALLGLTPDSNLLTIIKVCIAGIAILYVLKGGPPIP